MKANDFPPGKFITNKKEIYRVLYAGGFGGKENKVVSSLPGDNWEEVKLTRTLGKRVELDELEPCENYAVKTEDGWCIGGTNARCWFLWPDVSIAGGYGDSGCYEDLQRIIAIYELGDYSLGDNPNVPEAEKSLAEQLEDKLEVQFPDEVVACVFKILESFPKIAALLRKEGEK